MDLKLLPVEANEIERAAVATIIEHRSDLPEAEQVAGEGLQEARARRHLLLPALHAVQKKVGWISQGAFNEICRQLLIPPAEAYGVASFYALFSTNERPARVAHVCDDIACKLRGADGLCATLERKLGSPGTPSVNGKATWHRSPCLGLCERAPAVLFQLAGDGADGTVAPAKVEDIEEVLNGAAIPTPPSISTPQTTGPRDPALRLLRRVDACDPTSLAAYQSANGYAALRRAIEIGPAQVIAEVSGSKLQGRGGAAFPTGRKWDAVAKAPVKPHYLVCNADESEPGTFKDRVLMEEDPFAIVESMTIAGFAVGADQGYLYIRGEYPFATARLEHAIRECRSAGLLGPDVMGSGFSFDIDVRRGAGAYICGEETALFSSIEGFRGEPRNKPPFPVEVGLFGKPTVINNVETLANVLDILLEGRSAFAGVGTEQSTGSKLFCVSGAVEQPGLYEVPFGTTLRELLDLSGGISSGKRLKTVLLGGAAGSFVLPEHLDTPLTFEGTRAINASLGSGVVMAFDENAEMRGIVLRIAAFFRNESCGQCVPCRVGTVRQEELLQRLVRDDAQPSAEAELLDELAQVMRDASICGLGHTAANAVQSAVTLGLFGGLTDE
ncbi:MAG: NAD(P)H-dependent oxidoreductase subunit E [Vicinamibacterales bacterium]|jgi:NADH-quinone oxidoreductase subunit F|nr:NADH-quinone oxidoreductase subunit E [Acidobacteriota bacterium]MDP7210642.1 NAD(P)H-dependent oxidoreductase subunit E [Vicinamibacterales bacterium]HJO17388.1 NAD(P)H-dependent oxidoreductase subunit E [Vicinamibacterales bacterium]|tara:strand:+ start:456 stop:2294 length:1839 start_codon:yes stop_codon:yes gene_type:complete